MHASTMLNVASVAARVRQMVRTSGIEGTLFAEQVGVPYSTMRTYMANRLPSPEFLAAAYRSFGYMPHWLLTGDEPMLRAGTAPGTEALGEVVLVPVLGVQAAAGAGVCNEERAEYAVDGIHLTRRWLAARALNPATLRVITVRGASMGPVLTDGDQVLVDQSDILPRSGFVYVLRQGDELLVKYCQQLPGGVLRVSSANPAFQPYDVDLTKSTEVSVVGRVVASMHDW